MQPTIQAVLARFAGDRAQAYKYCLDVAGNHARLADEYYAIAWRLLEKPLLEEPRLARKVAP